MTTPDTDLVRRGMLVGAAALGLGVQVRVLAAVPIDLQTAIRQFAGDTPVQTGRVKLDIASLVENGNAVPITVSVDSPMHDDDHVKTIALFNERNPQRDVALFHLTPRSGRAQVATRIRLATSQKLVALARLSDGSVWSTSVEVTVTIAGCVEN
jgi:sulfur-oxidizing protein SoxY